MLVNQEFDRAQFLRALLSEIPPWYCIRSAIYYHELKMARLELIFTFTACTAAIFDLLHNNILGMTILGRVFKWDVCDPSFHPRQIWETLAIYRVWEGP